MEVVVTTGAVRCAELQLNHHQQSNTQLSYRPDALQSTGDTGGNKTTWTALIKRKRCSFIDTPYIAARYNVLISHIMKQVKNSHQHLTLGPNSSNNITVSEMTYTVSSGTLNPSIPYHSNNIIEYISPFSLKWVISYPILLITSYFFALQSYTSLINFPSAI